MRTESRALLVLLLTTASVGKATEPPRWPAEAVRVAEVSDLDAALAWSREHREHDPTELLQAFGLKTFPEGLSRATRLAWRESGLEQQALILWDVEDPAKLAVSPATRVTVGEGFLVVTETQKQGDRVAASLAEGKTSTLPGGDVVPRPPDERSEEPGEPRVWLAHRWPDSKTEPAARRHGFDRIESWGVVVDVDSHGGSDCVAKLSAEKPYASTLGMFDLQPEGLVECPAWITRLADQATVLRLSLPDSMRAFGPAFDDLYAQGIQGTYDEVLADVQDPDGLAMNLETQLYDQLGDTAVLGRVRPTIVPGHDRGFVALRCRKGCEEKVADAVRRLMTDDSEAELITLSEGGPLIWRYKEGSGMTSGIGVIGEWLCYADQSNALQALYKSNLMHADDEPFAVAPPSDAFPGGKYGAMLFDRQQDKMPADPFELFWHWGDDNDSFLRTGQLKPDVTNTLLGPLLRGATAWAASDEGGWRLRAVIKSKEE